MTKTIRIGGMTCINCRDRIEKKLKSTAGIEDAEVRYETGTAELRYDDSIITLKEITQIIESLDYRVLDGSHKEPVSRIIGTLVIILALYLLLRQFGVSGISSILPLAEAGMGYGMLFLIGLLTSVHCVAMCGGINLSQTLGRGKDQAVTDGDPAQASAGRLALLLPSLLYNAGRVISYTLVGAIVGALGSLITVSGRFQGAVQLIAGIFMVIMGINMLGLFQGLKRFNLHLPKIFGSKVESARNNKSPLIVGLLNGLMPCGPLQAMQLYALSTGSPLRGGISMLMFSLGTIPLMFGLGALSSLLSGSFGRSFSSRVMKAGAVLVTVLGLTMFTNGWSLGGLPSPVDALVSFVNPFASAAVSGPEEAFVPVIEDGVQIVRSSLSSGRYPPITVQQGIPVRWIIDAPRGSINGCNNRMIVREYGLEHSFTEGENIIEFTPERTGKFSYSCWMGMIRSSVTVVAEGESAASVAEPNTSPVPAGVDIPAESYAAAEMTSEGWQRVTINLSDEGFSPAIIVVQRDIPVLWIINNDSLDPGNGGIIVPAYYARMAIEQGENAVQFMPETDFEFSTADNIFYGYVKIVDDIAGADIEAVKAEVSEHETLIYPEAYFESGSQGSNCCAR
jgi:sulfite exporter TauE/SafE/copper chaperone CopZ/plastocyanin domain-containing protein